MSSKFFQITIFLFNIFVLTLASPAFATNDARYFAVQKNFYSDYRNICESINRAENNTLVEPEVIDLQYKFSYEEEDAPKSNFTLYIFPCRAGAYNFGSVFYGYDGVEGEINQLHFATPEYDVDYADDTFEKVSEIGLQGFSTTSTLFNPSFNPENNTIRSFIKWRGLADASASGLWQFENGKFVLKSFDVDATYDERINPIRIYGEGQLSRDE